MGFVTTERGEICDLQGAGQQVVNQVRGGLLLGQVDDDSNDAFASLLM
jgi:hypothetical protein